MTHYICSGSGQGVSKHPGVCTNKDCDQYSEALEPCDCQDEKHLKKIEEEEGEDNE